MVSPIYWGNLLPKIGKVIVGTPQFCVNVGVGLVCGVAQATGIQIFTQKSANEALDLVDAANTCQQELPVALSSNQEKVAEIMTEGGPDAVIQAKAVLKSSGVSDQCVAIFGMVCKAAQNTNALDIVKGACANLWI